MSIKSELDPHFRVVQEEVDIAQADLMEAASIVLGSRFLSCEVTLADEAQTGPFIAAVDNLRAESAVKEGRRAADPGTMVLPVALLRASRSHSLLELDLYTAMDKFEHDGTPPASKMFVIETSGVHRLNLRSDFLPVKRLIKTQNSPERARQLIVGHLQQIGMKALKNEVELRIGIDEDGEVTHYEENFGVVQTGNTDRRAANTAEKLHQLSENRYRQLEAQRFFFANGILPREIPIK